MDKKFIDVQGEEVAAVHHEADSDRWIFFCHGFGSNREGSYESRCEKAVEEGWNAVRFDFRGNGESDGDFIEQTLSSKIRDLEAVVDYFQPGKYALFGSSFGGKVVFHSGLEPEAVVTKAPVTYNRIMDKFREVVEQKGEFTHHPGATIDKRFFEDFDQYSFGDVEVEGPVAIFHGAGDETVHPENSFEAAQELDGDAMLQKFRGEKHSFTDEAEQRMQQQMFDWLELVFLQEPV